MPMTRAQRLAAVADLDKRFRHAPHESASETDYFTSHDQGCPSSPWITWYYPTQRCPYPELVGPPPEKEKARRKR